MKKTMILTATIKTNEPKERIKSYLDELGFENISLIVKEYK